MKEEVLNTTYAYLRTKAPIQIKLLNLGKDENI